MARRGVNHSLTMLADVSASRKAPMTDLSSVTSSISAAVTQQATNLKQAANTATSSFSSALARVETTVGIKPKTGFTSGPTYEANQAGTLVGQTKAAFNNTINAAKSVLHIK
jgi:hypothetical protein